MRHRSPGPLAGRYIVLGVTGGIAAYKAVDLCRRLVDAGAHVVPVMTADATRFVGAATFSALGSEPVRTSLWEGDPIPHTRLGQAADVVLVAPATARLIGELAAGISGDLLTATLLATRAPVVVCPAMHTEMWEHPAVQDNLRVLRRRGVRVVEPSTGRLAGGDVGPGRLADAHDVLDALESVLAAAGSRDLEGVRVLVSAGGTREAIDPVRYIGNRSSGKQGHAIADAARGRGAVVTIVTSTDRPVAPGVEVVRAETAAAMGDALLARSGDADVIVMAAAVADFRPVSPAGSKLHKTDGLPEIALEPTLDILSELASRRTPGQVLVGFAAETDDVASRAEAKLREKGVDLLVANDVSAPGAGFGHDTNSVLILGDDGFREDVSLTDKTKVAGAVLDAVVARLARRAT